MQRILAQAVSVIFHPLLMLTYGLAVIVAFNPFVFGVDSVLDKLPLILICLAYTFFLPAISVIFMALIGLVGSVQLRNREERIGPLIISIVFYTWFFINVHRNAEIPPIVGVLTLGSVIALSVAFFITVFSKLSLHAVGLGGLMGILLIMQWHFGYQSLSLAAVEVHIRLILLILVLLSGLVASARLELNAHAPKELYGGFLVGFTAQLIAMKFLF